MNSPYVQNIWEPIDVYVAWTHSLVSVRIYEKGHISRDAEQLKIWVVNNRRTNNTEVKSSNILKIYRKIAIIFLSSV